MTIALLAIAFAVLAWPIPRQADLRVRRLVDAARLAAPTAIRTARRRPTLSPRLVRPFCVGLAAACGFAWRGVLVGVACGVVAVAVVRLCADAADRRRAVVRDRDLSVALRALRAELDVGSRADLALSAAAEAGGAHRAAFEAAARAAREGGDVAAAVSGSGEVPREVVLVGQAWQVSATTGAPLADVLARIDSDVQARRDQWRVVDSALAGPRSSAVLLAALPVLGILLGMAMGARPLAVLFDSAAGRLLLCAGVLLDVGGVIWTARLIRSAQR
jgi:tight adherence protein B